MTDPLRGLIRVQITWMRGHDRWNWMIYNGSTQVARGEQLSYCEAVAIAGSWVEHLFPELPLTDLPRISGNGQSKKNP